ncbi:MAG: hypothetical protein ACREXY_08845, partial [Gammaproteobacteria bacterium]
MTISSTLGHLEVDADEFVRGLSIVLVATCSIMNFFSLAFCLALIAQTAMHLWLDRRQIRHVRHHRQRVPQAFAARIPLADHQKAADYTVTHARFAQYELLLESMLLLVWTLGGGLDL